MSTNFDGGSGVSGYATAGSCEPCGFDPSRVSPRDAVDQLRDFPRLWRSALAVHLDDPDPEAVLAGRLAPGEWTPLEHAGHVRDVLHALDIRVQRVLREDDPVLPETHVTPPAGANEQGMAVVLAALSVSADQLARTIDNAAPETWARSAHRAHRPVTALDLIREAVHEGTHHLRQATATLEQLRIAQTARS
jgi:hypothetical protein